MNYKLKQTLVWMFVAIMALANLAFLAWTFEDSIASYWSNESQSFDQINVSTLIYSFFQ